MHVLISLGGIQNRAKSIQDRLLACEEVKGSCQKAKSRPFYTVKVSKGCVACKKLLSFGNLVCILHNLILLGAELES
jgi:hypothetical protein